MTETARPRTLDPEKLAPLEGYLAHVWQASRIAVSNVALLSGGAVQENWAMTIAVDGGQLPGRHDVVLRTDARASLPVSLDRRAEVAVIEAAFDAGVSVPQPILNCEDGAIIGAPFLIQRRITGTANARTLARAKDREAWSTDVVFAIGAELARVHQITPVSDAGAGLSCLPQTLRSPGATEVERLRSALDGTADPRPALEYILCWLHDHAPPTVPLSLVHGDFRVGNMMVDGHRLTGVLDWEFAHWGDPAEDIGWFCARCWRFGNDELEAGGIAPRAVFYDGYRSVAPLPADGATVPFWEIMAAAKWAAISVLQGDRYRRGGEDALELVLTGLMAPEMELDALLQIDTLSRSLPR
ncbi:MAG: phosphotransferase family protein [Pseudomonadota bacterium]